MPRHRTLKVVAAVVALFAALVGTIIFLWEMEIISSEMAKLMVAELLGIYFGLGILFAVYRLLAKLD